ncbi:MAG: tetratricopeptide repeat protein [Bradyrhizobiaceae bacterium]|nr:tetratricopeptide repeat protein [Hyphomicrobiales bacterium]MBV9429538.1 tetratricopeptide repeat protein [Bradyrhizobiaceae bacterium]
MIPLEKILRDAEGAHRRGAIGEAKRLYRQALDADAGNVAACGNLAIIAAQEGDLAQAESLFRRVVAARPNYPEGHNNLGALLQQQGRLDEAIAEHRRALALRPDYAAAHLHLGNALKRQGKLNDALSGYESAVKLKPDLAEAWNNLGVVLQAQGKFAEALAAYERAMKLRPGDVEAAYNRAVALQQHGRRDEAENAYRVILCQSPNRFVYVNLGALLQEQGRLDEALGAFDAALALDRDYAEAHFNRGVVLQQQGRLGAAIESYWHALRLRPDYFEAATNAGIALQEMGRLDEAAGAFEHAAKLRPDAAEPHNNLGIAWLARGQPAEAVAAFQRALALKPDYAEAFYNLGNAWRELGKPEGAIAAYGQALRLRPDDADAFSQLVYQRWRACDWSSFAVDQQKMRELVRQGARVPPFFLLITDATPAEQLACARRWVEPFARAVPNVPRSKEREREGERIRLGYLSADFHQHATAHLAAELFERHDRARFEVFAYSYGPDNGSPMRRRLERAFDRFVDIRPFSHAQAAQRIDADGIDILIDLKGHTLNARTATLATRPAPIQVNYLGYPGSMGADFIDYIIVDRIVAPPDEQAYFTEKLVTLPGCYQPNSAREAAPAPARRDCGLPADGFVFCCFNNTYKITPQFFNIWMRLLQRVSGSVLWLLESNELARRNLRREAEQRGVDPGRLVFAPIRPIAEHLARHRHADLFLDTLPCTAHTTASDALWSGLPVLTCAGATLAGRVAASAVAAAGVPELIAPSLAAYEQLALGLARTPVRLRELRERLEKNRATAPLFDMAAYVRRLETAYTDMWERWRAGEPPAAFVVE